MLAVEADDPGGAWALMADEFRKVRAQWWLWNYRTVLRLDRDALERYLADFVSSSPALPEWAVFGKNELVLLRDAFAHWFDLLRAGTLGAAGATRLEGSGLERVIFAETEGVRVLTGPTFVESLVFWMAHTDQGWRILGAGRPPDEPGWPPTPSQIA